MYYLEHGMLPLLVCEAEHVIDNSLVLYSLALMFWAKVVCKKAVELCRVAV